MNSKSRFAFVVSALLLAASVSLSPAAECSLTGLAWMAGNWHNTTDPQRAQERWVIAPDNVLMGSSWEIPKGKVGFAEVMTVRPNANAISMYLRQGDHAGEHLTYKRSGDSLLIIGDFLHHGTPSHMEWRMSRAGD
jgi:hypothetical protein